VENYLSDAPRGVSEDVELVVHLLVAGHVDHGEFPPEFRRPVVVPRLLVHVLQVMLNLLSGRLQRGAVLVVRGGHLQQTGEQQRVLGHALYRDLRRRKRTGSHFVSWAACIIELVTIRNELRFILLRMVFSIWETLRKMRSSSRSFSMLANRADADA
jgi:hypothetical protein